MSINIQYLANDGFIVSSKNKKIMIDGLFKTKYNKDNMSPDGETYEQIPENELNKILKGFGIYKDIDIIFITHHHGDHFYSDYIIDYLENNSKTTLVSSTQVINILKKNNKYEKLRNKFIGVSDSSNEVEKFSINNINFTTIKLLHAGSKNYNDFNHLGFLFFIDNLSFLHIGDCLNDIDKIRNINNDKIKVDFAFFGYPVLDIPKVIDKIRNTIDVKNSIIMHLELGVKEKYKNRIKNELSEEEKRVFNNVIIFDGSLESKTF